MDSDLREVDARNFDLGQGGVQGRNLLCLVPNCFGRNWSESSCDVPRLLPTAASNGQECAFRQSNHDTVALARVD